MQHNLCVTQVKIREVLIKIHLDIADAGVYYFAHKDTIQGYAIHGVACMIFYEVHYIHCYKMYGHITELYRKAGK